MQQDEEPFGEGRDFKQFCCLQEDQMDSTVGLKVSEVSNFPVVVGLEMFNLEDRENSVLTHLNVTELEAIYTGGTPVLIFHQYCLHSSSFACFHDWCDKLYYFPCSLGSIQLLKAYKNLFIIPSVNIETLEINKSSQQLI